MTNRNKLVSQGNTLPLQR